IRAAAPGWTRRSGPAAAARPAARRAVAALRERADRRRHRRPRSRPRGRADRAEARRVSSATRTVEVPLGDRSYPIRLGFDILDQAGPAIAEATKARRVAIVTVPGVGRRYAARLERSLRAAGVKS